MTMKTDTLAQIAQNLIPLSSLQFSQISRLVYERCGICLDNGKESLVKARLMKRLKHLGLTSFSEYLKYLDEDRSMQELGSMIDALTTNKTSFFREFQHFEFIRSQVLPKLKESGSSGTFWSAGCSTGEEPYSLAILLKEELPEANSRQCRILATDISHTVLDRARAAAYAEEVIPKDNASLLKKHLIRIQSKPAPLYRISDEARKMVQFAHLNLTDRWPMQGPFDLILCRNVMIYFDQETRKKLVHRFWELLKHGGHLFVGHSESLTSSSAEFKYVQPAIYLKQ
jgi:chemotaxis protein methyltransferase CheR